MQKKSNPNQQTASCILCSEKHFLTGCPRYTSQTTQQRYSLVMKHGLCYNCLGKHRVSECRSTRRCTKCGKKHHTTIHKRDPSNVENKSELANLNASTESSKPGPVQVSHVAIHSVQTSTDCILLATAQVRVSNKTGSTLRIRSLIDQGSEVTLISERAVQLLKLPRTKTFIPLVGVGEQSASRTRGVTSFKITSRHENSEEF